MSYLRDRLSIALKLLTDSGSCFLQIGDENVHLVRSLMDEIFGSENFVTMITVRKTHTAGSPSGGTAVLASVSDYLLWYAKDLDSIKYHQLYEHRRGYDWVNYDFVASIDGRSRKITKGEKSGLIPLHPRERVYRRSPLTSASSPESARFPVTHDGSTYTPGRGGWKTNALGMERLSAANRLEAYGSTLAFRRFTDDFPYFPRTNLWTDTARGGYGEDQWYVVQTGAKVIERCILMCTDPGDLVMDPTCGSGTTAYVAEQWGRRWITIDTSRVALALARQRVMAARYPWYLLADSAEGHAKEQSLTVHTLPRVEFAGDVRAGFVCDRAPHVMLKSIANNPDIRHGMSQVEIDAAIKRHAEFELLYEQPFEDAKKVRVAGPFTVESLSPHRSLAFAGGPGTEPLAETEAAKEADALNFEQSILDNWQRRAYRTGGVTSVSTSPRSRPTPASTSRRLVSAQATRMMEHRPGSRSRSVRSTARSARRT